MRRALALLVLAVVALSACARPEPGRERANRQIRIGFSMDTLREERWQRDRDLFVARARELGARVIVQAAAGDDYLQRAQAENMITRGVDVLVVVPHDAAAMAPVVAKAHAAGVKVIAYDRLITGAAVDFYVSFDSEKVGELQARHLLKQVPRGNYVYIGGAPTDHNAHLLRRGAMKVLEPLERAGTIRIAFDAMTPEWRPEAAQQLMEEALAWTNCRVDAVIAANDATAGGAIQALASHGLAGRIPVSGQDADLAAVRRLVRGTQAMTVYKPIRLLAMQAAEIAVAMARGQAPPANAAVHNGHGEVPARLLPPVAVDSANLAETVIQDGFHRYEDLFGP